MRSGLLSDFLTSATPSPEPAGLSSFLPLDSFPDTFSTFRLVTFFGLPICTTVLLERGLIFWIISCRSAFQTLVRQGKTEAKQREDCQRARLVPENLPTNQYKDVG